MIIMGIDPGFAITGYSIISHIGNKFKLIKYGVITTEANTELSKRLLTLNNELEVIIDEFKPEAIAVEELFFAKNTKTAINVGHGRGVILVCGARKCVKIFEYTPLQVKQAVTGYGRADKSQVQQMVKSIMNMEKIPKPDDAADAIAIAICHAHSSKYNFALI